ncbi:MAG: hypothetical protein HPY81_07035 [Firmicutes bacterium]|nr:hypothetical protein [Bacillota bacterium]
MSGFLPLNEVVGLLRVQRHDFLNHLQVIMGFLQLNKPEQALAYLRKISAQLQEAGKVMRLPWPELVAVLLLAEKQAEQDQVDLTIEVAVNMANAKVDGMTLAQSLGQLFKAIFPELLKYPVESRLLRVRLAEEKGGCLVTLVWPAGGESDFSLPVVNVAKQVSGPSIKHVNWDINEGYCYIELLIL